ncbi:hypothetical protein AIGOOFII_2919 [Methylobacterium marchantiae]|nr:hypothetical protein AIGOOFII_2919 [Methylobacterium marchantiae]
MIAQPKGLIPGPYRFEASILRDCPEFHGLTAHLQLALPGRKISFGWRSDLLFWGSAANYYLIGPFALSLAFVLIGLELGRWLALRGNR